MAPSWIPSSLLIPLFSGEVGGGVEFSGAQVRWMLIRGVRGDLGAAACRGAPGFAAVGACGVVLGGSCLRDLAGGVSAAAMVHVAAGGVVCVRFLEALRESVAPAGPSAAAVLHVLSSVGFSLPAAALWWQLRAAFAPLRRSCGDDEGFCFLRCSFGVVDDAVNIAGAANRRIVYLLLAKGRVISTSPSGGSLFLIGSLRVADGGCFFPYLRRREVGRCASSAPVRLGSLRRWLLRLFPMFGASRLRDGWDSTPVSAGGFFSGAGVLLLPEWWRCGGGRRSVLESFTFTFRSLVWLLVFSLYSRDLYVSWGCNVLAV